MLLILIKIVSTACCQLSFLNHFLFISDKHENNTGANKTSKQSSTTSTTSTTTTTITTASILPTSTMINPTDEQNTKVEATLSVSTVTQNATSVNKTSMVRENYVWSASVTFSAEMV